VATSEATPNPGIGGKVPSERPKFRAYFVHRVAAVILRRLPLWTLLALLATPALASAGDAPYVSSGSYLAAGRGGQGMGTGRGEGGYAASGFDVRSLSLEGHGGFARMEYGMAGFFESAAGGAGSHVVALDMGYAFGGPILGQWARGLLGFIEVGVTTWQMAAAPMDEFIRAHSGFDGRGLAGFGMTVGAVLEGDVGPFRVGVAVHRRDLPFMVAAQESYASSMTVAFRIMGAI
jgi:hypothetical protein